MKNTTRAILAPEGGLTDLCLIQHSRGPNLWYCPKCRNNSSTPAPHPEKSTKRKVSPPTLVNCPSSGLCVDHYIRCVNLVPAWYSIACDLRIHGAYNELYKNFCHLSVQQCEISIVAWTTLSFLDEHVLGALDFMIVTHRVFDRLIGKNVLQFLSISAHNLIWSNI